MHDDTIEVDVVILIVQLFLVINPLFKCFKINFTARIIFSSSSLPSLKVQFANVWSSSPSVLVFATNEENWK